MTINIYNNKFRKLLFEKIINLSITEHEEIFKMIKLNDINFSQNKNGIFFNLSTIDDKVIKEIHNFVGYCITNKTELDKYENKLNECKINNNFENIMPILPKQPCLIEYSVKTKDIDDNWNILNSIDSKKLAKIAIFVEKMGTDRDKIGKKKLNVKFHNARKKYSKKIFNDKRLGDINNINGIELLQDKY
jgi:hypothetical protein